MVNTPLARLAVEDQIYITSIGIVAHAYHSSGNHLLYLNRLLTIWNELHEIATSIGLLSSHSLDTSCRTMQNSYKQDIGPSTSGIKMWHASMEIMWASL